MEISKTNFVPDIEEVEKFIYKTYIEGYLDKINTVNFNNKKYEIDGLKHFFLTSIMDFGLNKIKLDKSNIHGNGIFAITYFSNNLYTDLISSSSIRTKSNPPRE